MEDLQQLVRIIERKGRLPGSQLLNFSDEDNLETKLYNYLKSNENLNERAAIKLLYSTDNKDAFKMLKSRFRKKLLNQLNYLDFTTSDNNNKLEEIEIKCNKLLSEATILIRSNSKKLAEKLVLKALKYSEECHLTKKYIDALELYFEIAVYFNLKSKVYNIKEELEEQYKKLDLEREANLLYNVSLSEFREGVNSRDLFIPQLKSNLVSLKKLWYKTKSSLIYSRYYFLKMMLLEATGNFKDQISFIKETRKLYEEGVIHPFYFKEAYNSYILVYAYLRSGLLEEGLIEAEKLNQVLKPGVSNWFGHNENYFLLSVYSKKYDKANEILNDVISNLAFEYIKPVAKERWYIIVGIYSLIRDVDLPSNFILNPKETTQDKKGFNIWLIILNFLTLLKQEQHELLYRETEKIRKYISRYLDSKADPRNKLFLKLLLLVVKEDFDPIRCRQKSRYLFNKLSQLTPAGDAYAEVEIVPFEHLWEFILNMLEEQKKKIVKR